MKTHSLNCMQEAQSLNLGRYTCCLGLVFCISISFLQYYLKKTMFSIFLRTLRNPFIPSTLIIISLNELSLIERWTEVPIYRKRTLSRAFLSRKNYTEYFSKSNTSAVNLMETVTWSCFSVKIQVFCDCCAVPTGKWVRGGVVVKALRY
jgi:ABC-type sugar transport system permease subunit